MGYCTTVGIDISSRQSATGVCVLEGSPERARITLLSECGFDESEQLLGITRDPAVEKVAIDTPFGWPEPFASAITEYGRMRLGAVAGIPDSPDTGLVGGQRSRTRSVRGVSSASAMCLAVGMVVACQPRSSSPRYLGSMRGMRPATSSSVSPRSWRRVRTAWPKA